jgi:hypothetical protein
LKAAFRKTGSIAPDGAGFFFVRIPSAKAPGYFRPALRALARVSNCTARAKTARKSIAIAARLFIVAGFKLAFDWF